MRTHHDEEPVVVAVGVRRVVVEGDEGEDHGGRGQGAQLALARDHRVPLRGRRLHLEEHLRTRVHFFVQVCSI